MNKKFRQLTEDEANEVANYLKTVALHDANTRGYYMSASVTRQKDEDSNAMISLQVNIAYIP